MALRKQWDESQLVISGDEECSYVSKVVKDITERQPVSKIACPAPNCGFIRWIWSWDDDERDRVWEWLQRHLRAYHGGTFPDVAKL